MSRTPSMLPQPNVPQPEGWLYRKSGDLSAKPAGYFDDKQIVIEVNEGRLEDSHEVWHAVHTQGDWRPASRIKAFSQRFAVGRTYLAQHRAARDARREADRAAAERVLRERAAEESHAKQAMHPDTVVQTPPIETPSFMRLYRSPRSWVAGFVVFICGLGLVVTLLIVAFSRNQSNSLASTPKASDDLTPRDGPEVTSSSGIDERELLAQFERSFLSLGEQANNGQPLTEPGQLKTAKHLASQHVRAYLAAAKETEQLMAGPAADRLEKTLDDSLQFPIENIPIDGRGGMQMQNEVPVNFGSQEQKEEWLKVHRLMQKYGREIVKMLRARRIIILRPLNGDPLAKGQTRHLVGALEVLFSENQIMRVLKLPGGEVVAALGPCDLPERGDYDPSANGPPAYAVYCTGAMREMRFPSGETKLLPLVDIVSVRILLTTGALDRLEFVIDGMPVDQWISSNFDSRTTLKHLLHIVKNDHDLK